MIKITTATKDFTVDGVQFTADLKSYGFDKDTSEWVSDFSYDISRDDEDYDWVSRPNIGALKILNSALVIANELRVEMGLPYIEVSGYSDQQHAVYAYFLKKRPDLQKWIHLDDESAEEYR